MIAFDFNRAKTRRRLITYSAIVLAGFAFMLASWNWSWRCIPVVALVATHTTPYCQWVGILGRGLRRQGIAMFVNFGGVVDNASDYTLGQITWAEIEKTYPWDWETRLITDRWKRMPVLTKERGIVIILKNDVDFETRLRGKSWIVRSAFKEKLKRERSRWLFIPEALLSVTADEMMTQLNNFYLTEVRGAA